jgi:hypothetical protein
VPWYRLPLLVLAIPIGIFIAARDRFDAWRYSE